MFAHTEQYNLPFRFQLPQIKEMTDIFYQAKAINTEYLDDFLDFMATQETKDVTIRLPFEMRSSNSDAAVNQLKLANWTFL